MHQVELMHPPLMSLPSRSESSLVRSASQISQPGLYIRNDALMLFSARLAASWRLLAFLEFLGPTAILPMQRHPQAPLSLHSHLARLAGLATLRPRAFSTPRRFIPHWSLRPCFVSVPPVGFHFPFEGFSPSVAPGASRLAVSSLPLSVRLPCGTRLRSASRMSASGGCVVAASRV